jgi:prenyltransferase beta subunit
MDELALDKHRAYVRGEFEAMKRKDSFQYCVTEHLGMGGVYWGQAAMGLLRDEWDQREKV